MVKTVYVLARARDALSHVVSMELAQLPEQPAVPRLVYLLKSDRALRGFLNHNSTLRVSDYGYNQPPLVRSIQLMSACNPPEYEDGQFAPVESLVCSFNKPRDVSALHKYKRNLSTGSSVLLLNSDRSYLDSMKKLLWQNDAVRPELYQCISDFRTWSYGDFQSGVIGDGSLKIARIPRSATDEEYDLDLSQTYKDVEFLSSIKQTQRLNPVFMKYRDFALHQYEQMIVKTAVGSLTAVHDCTNGELLKLKYTYEMLGYVIGDCLRIIRNSSNGTNLHADDNVALSKERLMDVCISLLRKTQGESSQLRRQVHVWNATEVMNTTGYFAYLARQTKVRAPHVNMMNKILEDRISLAHTRGGKVSLGDDAL